MNFFIVEGEIMIDEEINKIFWEGVYNDIYFVLDSEKVSNFGQCKILSVARVKREFGIGCNCNGVNAARDIKMEGICDDKH